MPILKISTLRRFSEVITAGPEVFDRILEEGDMNAEYAALEFEEGNASRILRFALGHSEGIYVCYEEEIEDGGELESVDYSPIGSNLTGKKSLEYVGVLRRNFVKEEIARKIVEYFMQSGERWPGVAWEPAISFSYEDILDNRNEYHWDN